MDDLQNIIWVLERSVKRNGEQPLTNKWLLNIMKMAERKAVYDASNEYLAEIDYIPDPITGQEIP